MHRLSREAHRKKAITHARYRQNANDWAVASVSTLYGASAASYAGKTRLRT